MGGGGGGLIKKGGPTKKTNINKRGRLLFGTGK